MAKTLINTTKHSALFTEWVLYKKKLLYELVLFKLEMSMIQLCSGNTHNKVLNGEHFRS